MKNTQVLAMAGFTLLMLLSCNSKELKTGETEHATAIQNDSVVSPKDGIFIHLSHGPEDPQRVLMALNMAKMMSEDKEVLLYLDIKAVYVVLKEAPDITFKAFPSSLQLLEELKNKGVTVMVCPGCLKAADKTPEEVMEWVQIAQKDKFFSFTDGKIVTIDY